MNVTAPPSGALQGGVNMSLGPEVALNDAEGLLLEQKKKSLLLEEKMHDVYTEKNIAEKTIRELNQQRQEDLKELRLVGEQQRDLTHSLLYAFYFVEYN